MLLPILGCIVILIGIAIIVYQTFWKAETKVEQAVGGTGLLIAIACLFFALAITL